MVTHELLVPGAWLETSPCFFRSINKWHQDDLSLDALPSRLLTDLMPVPSGLIFPFTSSFSSFHDILPKAWSGKLCSLFILLIFLNSVIHIYISWNLTLTWLSLILLCQNLYRHFWVAVVCVWALWCHPLWLEALSRGQAQQAGLCCC